MARVVFMGTAAEALPVLRALVGGGHEVALVVAPVDAVAGRGCGLREPPVKTAALALGLPLLQTDKVSSPENAEAIGALKPDALVVVAFGQILSRRLLAAARWGGINVHFSLLPKWRGAAPLERALLAGDDGIGVSVIRMVAKVDAGPVLAVREWPGGAADDRGTLKTRLAHVGADLVLGALARLERGVAHVTHQAGWQTTAAAKVAESEYRLDWSQPAAAIVNLVRAASPEPGASTELRGRRLKLGCARVLDRGGGAVQPGVVGAVVDDGIVMGCGDGALLFRQGQLEGRKWMPAAALAHGMRLRAGDRLGSADSA